MNRVRLKTLSLAMMVGLGVPVLAEAGLAGLRVLSGAGEPFLAEIPIVDETFISPPQVALADRNHFAMLAPYSGNYASLSFSLVPAGSGGGKYKVVVRASEPLEGEVMHFAVALSWPAGRMVREYEVDPRTLEGGGGKAPAKEKHKPDVTPPTDAKLRPPLLGLGKLSVQSALGEPLRAEIVLNGTALQQRRQPHMQLLPVLESGHELTAQATLNQIELRLERISGQRAVLSLSSRQPLNESTLSFRLEVGLGDAAAARAYTLLLDPASRAAEPVATQDKLVEREKRAESAYHPRLAVQPGSKSYMVKPGETLGMIAARFHGGGGQLERIKWLHSMNRMAFINGDINRVLAGAKLRYPAEWQLQTAPADSAQTAFQSVVVVPPLPPAIAMPSGVAKPQVVPADAILSPTDQAKLAKERQLIALLAKQDQELARIEQRARDLEQRLSGSSVGTQAKVAELPPATEKTPISAPQAPVAPEASAVAAARIPAVATQSIAASQPAPEVKAEPAAPSAAPPVQSATPAPVVTQEVSTPPVKDTTPSSLEGDVLDASKPLMYAGMAGIGGMLALWLVRRRRREQGTSSREEVLLAQLKAEVAERHPVGSVEQPITPIEVIEPPTRAAGFTLDKQDLNASMLTVGPLTTLMSPASGATMVSGIDRLAEVEVYLAYGRVDQALEILREGIDEEPLRPDLRIRLLEVLAEEPERHAEFLQAAVTARDILGEDSVSWVKICEIGERVSPGHALFAMAVERQRQEEASVRVVQASSNEVLSEGGTAEPEISGLPKSQQDLVRLYLEMGDRDAADEIINSGIRGA